MDARADGHKAVQRGSSVRNIIPVCANGIIAFEAACLAAICVALIGSL
jgi:hypothetical protein